jgi:hypothetical protein
VRVRLAEVVGLNAGDEVALAAMVEGVGDQSRKR